MPTYLEMQDRIARETRFSSTVAASGLAQEIKDAIKSAIQYYENELFWFNEQQATTNTVVAQEYYSFPPDFVQMHAIARKRTDTEWDPLRPLSFDEVEDLNNSGRQAMPRYYCSYNEQLRLSPVPNAVYSLRLSYGRLILPVLSADDDTNAWTTEAEPLIRARAKSILLADALHDAANAQAQDTIAEMWFGRFQKRTRQYIGSSQIAQQVF